MAGLRWRWLALLAGLARPTVAFGPIPTQLRLRTVRSQSLALVAQVSQLPPPPDLPSSSPKPSLGEAEHRHPRLILAVLLALYITNQWARMLPSYLVSFDETRLALPGAAHELMNADLKFNQAQYGLLVSYGFSLLYTICALPAGAACDLFSRKLILMGSAAGWGAATISSSFARSYNHVFVARIMLSVSQAFATPASISLISSVFPSGARATATSIYSSGIYVGAALASLSVVLSRRFGWRSTALIAGAASTLPAVLLAAVLRERGAQPAPDAPPAPRTMRVAAVPSEVADKAKSAASPTRLLTVLSVPSVRLLLAAAAVRFFAGFAIGAWTPPFYRTYFGAQAASFAVLNALIVAGAGSLSVVSGGWFADRLVRRGKAHRVALVPAVGSLLAIPFWVLAMQAPNFYLSMLGLCAAYLCAECWYGVTISMMQAGLPSTVRGTAQGLLNMVQVIGNASPLLIGYLLTRGASLRRLATVVTPTAYVICAILFWLAGEARQLEQDAATATSA
ncbi:hypothetical protein AB1Y20_001135 [Prymnesium parvum]|uniref:Major facilitator superfamily (MFS) profile domain-containing protein n=1 Tax=Prymnesium parvum TaxID=97485 RepID=A0AB34K7C3_PRYPA